MKPKLTKPDIYSNCCLECGFPSLTAHYDGCSKTTKPEESVKESGWEEEFDNKVKEMPKKLIELVEWNKIKDFIRQLYQQALAEGKRIGREEVVDEADLLLAMVQSTTEDTHHSEIIEMIGNIRNALSSDGEKKGER